MTGALRLDSISKRFGSHVAVDDLSLTVGHGEFVTVLGPSGSGKSTTLRLIAGLDQPDKGAIAIGGADATALPPHRRDCAMVFQDYALFPHLTVAENVAFGPRMAGLTWQETTHRVHRLLDLVGLHGQGPKKPWALSGGQQQRVALARALAVEPAVLLLDEPLGALDFSLRRQMQSELREIQRETGRAFLHVTHDQGEALALSDRIVVLNDGKIVQTGTPEDVWERPASRFVAEFMGFRNLLPVEVVGHDRIRIAGVELAMPPGGRGAAGTLVAAIRPERIRIGAPYTGSALVRGVVRSSTYAGSSWLHEISTGDGTLIEARAEREVPIGDAVHLSIDPAHIILLPE